jgi:membrane-associated phospholipid phosphatase
MYLALAGLALAWAAMLLFGGMELDRGLLLVAYAGRDPNVTEAARWLTELGGLTVLIAATAAGAAWLLWRRDWRNALLLVAVTLSGRLLVALQKDWTARLRPEANEHLVAAQSLAFPSGHAANATLVWLGLALLLPRAERARAFAIWGAVWLALAVGASRVMLGVHWPSDVIAGWSFGLLWLLLLLRLAGHGAAEGTPPSAAH